MTFSVRLSPHAARQYRKAPPTVQSTLQSALDGLQANPLKGAQVKHLLGRLRAYYRYRVGDYRILYTVDRRQHIVYIDYIQHRRDVYRQAE